MTTPSCPVTTTTEQNPIPAWLRAVATWLVIFPCVTLGQYALTPLDTFPMVMRAALLTGIVVPFAVYLGVPAVLRAISSMTARGHRRLLTRGAK